MSKYITKRVLVSLGTLIVILFVLFLMLDKMPGSPFNDEKLTEAQKALLYAKYGLDQPFFVRFAKYFIAMMKGDLGVSYVISKNKAVADLVAAPLWLSALPVFSSPLPTFPASPLRVSAAALSLSGSTSAAALSAIVSTDTAEDPPAPATGFVKDSASSLYSSSAAL